MLFNYTDVSEENLTYHVHVTLRNLLNSIRPRVVTILTGGNALGKSFIRKQLPFSILEKLKIEEPETDFKVNRLVSQVSMQLRTDSNPLWGALSSMGADLPWESTSEHTITSIKGLLKAVTESEDPKDKRYLVIDELEIGMSKEVTLGMCEYLNSILDEILPKTYGILVITHSEIVVRTLKHFEFLNIEGLNEKDWLDRKIEPIDPSVLQNWSDKLCSYIVSLEKKAKDKENKK